MFFVFTYAVSEGQDSVRNAFGISVAAGTFVDYKPITVYPSFDVNVYLKNNHLEIESGVLGGNAYPIKYYLNSYVGARLNYRVKNLHVGIASRVMFSHHKYNFQSYTANYESRTLLSFNSGPFVTRSIGRLHLSCEYFFWWANYYTGTEGTVINEFSGFVKTGILQFRVAVPIKRWQ